jgi:glycosyltransferase involved in cell wall biosynthesis
MAFPVFEIFQVIWDKLISILFYRSCDVVIGYNTNNMLCAISNGAHPAKTKLSRIKIELSMLDIKKKERDEIGALPENGKIISLWSRLSPEKCVLEAIQGFEKLLQLSNEDLHFIVIGEGPEKSRIMSYLEKSACKDRVHLLDQRDREFIAQVALHSSLSVVPYGGSSLVEAVMLGIPVVAFDIEWHNELIRDGETGYLADFPDTTHLAEKMFEILFNHEEAQKRAVAAKQLAIRMFNVETTDLKEMRYYKPLFS